MENDLLSYEKVKSIRRKWGLKNKGLKLYLSVESIEIYLYVWRERQASRMTRKIL